MIGARTVLVGAIIAGGLLLGSLAFYIHHVEQSLVRANVDDALARADRARPAVDVQRALEAMELVTVVLETSVKSRAVDESWRGDVSATVTTPVRLLYGTDLSAASVKVLNLGPLARQWTVIVPPPRRLAAELSTGDEHTDLDLGWLRFRTRAGEYFLGQARKNLSDAVRAMALSTADSEMVFEQTRQRVERLVRLVVGQEGGRVVVEFAEPTQPATQAAVKP